MSQVIYEDSARQRVLEGARILYEAVKTTMGPKGRNIVILNETGSPTVTHDGVTVAKSVNILDKEETLGQRAGAELIKEVATKMNDVAGDGTTTVTVLTYHILNEANKLITAGHNPMVIRKELEAAAELVIAELDKQAEDITDNLARVKEVATISAGDEEIGRIIAEEVIAKIGKDGVIVVEEGRGKSIESEIVEGFTFDKGYISPYMVTDSARGEAVYKDPSILVTDKSISAVKDLIPVLEKLADVGKRDLVLILDSLEGEALITLISNHLQGTFNVVAIPAPAVGDRRTDALNDIALLTGAKVISTDRADEFSESGVEVIGTASKVVVTAHDTTIIGGAGNKEDLDLHLSNLQSLSDLSDDNEYKDYIARRRAGLEGRIALLRVGGATDTEIQERRFRVDDAVAAVQAALKEGIVAGGGNTLLHIAEKLSSNDIGTQLLKSALSKPSRIILENAGLNPDEWLPKMLTVKAGLGIDVSNPGELIDLKKQGVVDPVVVTKEAVRNSVSVAGVGMTMGGIVLNEVPSAEESELKKLMNVARD